MRRIKIARSRLTKDPGGKRAAKHAEVAERALATIQSIVCSITIKCKTYFATFIVYLSCSTKPFFQFEVRFPFLVLRFLINILVFEFT